MGEVKEEIKGGAPKRKAKSLDAQNMLDTVRSLKDEVSELVTIKDLDISSEGAEESPENQRKAATLRACHSLLSTVQVLMEDY